MLLKTEIQLSVNYERRKQLLKKIFQSKRNESKKEEETKVEEVAIVKELPKEVKKEEEAKVKKERVKILEKLKSINQR